MDQFALCVRSMSEQGNLHELADYLSKNIDLLMRNSTHLHSVLEGLDLHQHSLGVMALLLVKLKQSNINDWEDLFSKVSIFLTECNPHQIRCASSMFAELCHLFTQQLVDRSTPLIGISLLLRALSKLQASDTVLTSVASDVFKLCLLAKCFSPALPLLRADLNDISNEAASDPTYILLYFYYAALILAAVKEYDRALFYLEACVTTPAVAVSHIMIEAYKKYLMVGLIVSGDKAKDHWYLPKFASPVVNKYIRPLCSAYGDLVNAFYTNSINELDVTIAKHRDVFSADGNVGLVEQVRLSLIKTNIKRLTKTFLTLSLDDVAVRVGLSSQGDAERHLVTLVQEGGIHARISQRDGMVTFDSNPERFASANILNKLETDINFIVQLDARIASMEEDILLNPAYIKKCSSIISGGAGGTAVGGASAGSNDRGTTNMEYCEDSLVASSSTAATSATTSSSTFPSSL